MVMPRHGKEPMLQETKSDLLQEIARLVDGLTKEQLDELLATLK